MADFHFIRPYWLFGLVALCIALYLLKKMRVSQSGWQGILPKHLANVLITNTTKQKPLSLFIPFIMGLLAIIAMAGPSWQKLPQPVYQLARGSVLIMDMSYSMLATDLAPNRLTRSRYKAIDLLDNINEGEMGLIAYAGDAFIISPLTEDINNIKLLLPSLSPDLMPELGSDPMRALILADEMLKNAGHIDGDIYWFTDGIENSEIQDITKWSRNHTYALNILGVGTKDGAPIKLTNGEFMKDNNGAIVIPKLVESPLKVSAKSGGGHYSRLKNNNQDIKTLLKNLSDLSSKPENKQKESTQLGDQWEETGPYLVLLILPLVLVYFRRGKLLTFLPFTLLLMPNEQVYANIWDNLWQTNNQQAQQKFNQKQFKAAAEQFNDPLWQGSAHYKAGNFEQALQSFEKSHTAKALYNQGNTLAKLNKLNEAIERYEQALAKNPALEDAKTNKQLVEQLKKQQEQEKKSDQNQQNKDQQGDDQKNEKQQSNEQQNSEQNQDQSGDQSGEQNQSEQNGEENREPSNNQQSSEQNNDADSQNAQQDSQSNESEQNTEKNAEKSESEQQAKSDKSDKSDKTVNEKQKQNLSEQEKSDEESETQKTQAMRMAEKLAQEAEQKHQQILNKVTDDPYQLLRNKMQLEYKKRRQNRSSLGATKKW